VYPINKCNYYLSIKINLKTNKTTEVNEYKVPTSPLTRVKKTCGWKCLICTISEPLKNFDEQGYLCPARDWDVSNGGNSVQW
jgi:hypothetical protein